jgi:chitinase
MNEIITKAEFDYLWVQFYNNPGCSVNGPINYDDWKVNIANTPSAEAKIFIGVPASPLGATGTESGAQYYLTPSELASLVSQYDSDPAFGGVMIWSAAWSDSNVINSNTYAQEAKQILSSGSMSSGSGSKSSTSPTVASPTVAPPAVASPAVASTAVGSATVVSITAASTITLSAAAIVTESETVAQWDQVRVF